MHRRLRIVIAGAMLASMQAVADGPALQLKSRIAGQRTHVAVAEGRKTDVIIKTDGPLGDGQAQVQYRADQCLDLIGRFYPGVCVPEGPGLPVSPD